MKPAIRKLIESTVRDRFGTEAIDSVRVTEDVDDEGDHLYRVTVVLAGEGLLDAQKTAGLVRHLRHGLRRLQADSFPLVSFVSKSDATSLTSDAA